MALEEVAEISPVEAINLTSVPVAIKWPASEVMVRLPAVVFQVEAAPVVMLPMPAKVIEVPVVVAVPATSKEVLNLPVPTTSKVYDGAAVPMPTRFVYGLTKRMLVSTAKPPAIVVVAAGP